MLDIKFIRENSDLVREGIENKGEKIDVGKLLMLDKKRRELISQVEKLQSQQNKASKNIKGKDEAIISDMKKIKEEIKKAGAELEKVEIEFNELMQQIPNLPFSDVPIGNGEEDNKILWEKGRIPKFNFEIKDHVKLGEDLDLIDIKRAVKIVGSRAYFLKNEAALIEIALINYTWDLLLKRGFKPIFPPILSKLEVVAKTGHPEALSDDAFKIAQDDLILVGSSEQSLAVMHQDEVLDLSELPLRYTAFSSCFRREAGSYGKDTQGIIRVHQFDKIEMFSFVKPENSKEEFNFLVGIQEELVRGLKLPYHMVEICTGDMGFANAKQYDVEVWIPSQNKYRETHSASNCTDFQSRRTNTKYKTEEDKKEFAHTLNATGFAIPRILVAILENYQQSDGSVKIPKVLQSYLGMKVIKKK